MAECLSSAAQVRAAHGTAAWSTWRNVDGRKCWMVGARRGHVAQQVEQRPLKAKVVGSIPAVAANSPATREPENIEVARKAVFTCDDNCMRLWQAFQDLDTMGRLIPYRVRSAAKDAAYTAWLNQH